MNESGTFAPTVVVDGKTVTPAGWMWILGLALAGCDWAIKEASTEDFKNRVRLWYAEKEAYYAAHDMDEHQKGLDESRIVAEKAAVEIAHLKKELRL